MTASHLQVVVADANVLINLMHVARLDLCAELPGLDFVVPDHVQIEIKRPEQRAQLETAVTAGFLRIVSIDDREDFVLFAKLTERLGRGEAACLVLAVRNGWMVASDEKGRFRREAVSRIGKERLIGTADLYIRAIRAGLVTVDEADADKATLAGKFFVMSFGSFREMVSEGGERLPGDRGTHNRKDETPMGLT